MNNAKKRWTTPEQTAFLESNIVEFLRAQTEGKLKRFWSILEKDWFDRWSERDRLYPTSSSEEEPPALSPIAVLDLQKAIVARKGVSLII
jgi:hypothetical protein